MPGQINPPAIPITLSTQVYNVHFRPETGAEAKY
jgi:hypothetical protein